MTNSYQHEFRIVPSAEQELEHAPRQPYNMRILVAGLVVVGMGSLLYLGSPWSDESQEASALIGIHLWGSKRKHKRKSKNHHKHKEWLPDQYTVYPGLQLPGYPSLKEQEQYLNDLRDINWHAVEKDLEKLMTESQDCKAKVDGFQRFVSNLTHCVFSYC